MCPACGSPEIAPGGKAETFSYAIPGIKKSRLDKESVSGDMSERRVEKPSSSPTTRTVTDLEIENEEPDTLIISSRKENVLPPDVVTEPLPTQLSLLT
jgi:hypothetical protein